MPGLSIFHPDCPKIFRSIEAVVNYVPRLRERNSKVISEFNRHVGIKTTDYRDMYTNPKVAASPSSKSSMYSNPAHSRLKTGSAVGKGACGGCTNCMKAPCEKCFMCKEDAAGDGTSCLQKVWLLAPTIECGRCTVCSHLAALPLPYDTNRCVAKCQ